MAVLEGPTPRVYWLDEVAGWLKKNPPTPELGPEWVVAPDLGPTDYSQWEVVGHLDGKGIKIASLFDDVITAKKERSMSTPMTKKWYEAVADVIATTVLDPDERRVVADRIATIFSEVPTFQRQRFIAACAPEDAPEVSAAVLLERSRILTGIWAIPRDIVDLSRGEDLLVRVAAIVGLDEA